MQRTLLTLALIATAGVAQAQTMQPASPSGGPVIGRDDWVRQKGDQPGPASRTAAPGGAAMSTGMMSPSAATAPTTATGEPRDPYGRPFVGRNDWMRQPGDQPGAGSSATTTSTGVPREATFKDEFGHRYDAQGNRLDARGNIISPQTK